MPRKSRYALLTVDTEALPLRATHDHVQRLVWGKHPNGQAGIREMCAIGDEFGAKHVFFVDFCGAYTQLEEMKDVARWLHAQGQDVQLHTHPEYLPSNFWPAHNLPETPKYTNDYPEDRATFVMHHFGSLLASVTGKPVQAFRAGSFRWNAGTLRALATENIPLSFNNTIGAVLNAQALHALPTTQPFRWANGILEIPVTEQQILPALNKPLWARAQFPQSRYAQYRPRWLSFLPFSLRHTEPLLVPLIHSWSLMTRSALGHAVIENDKPLVEYRKWVKRIAHDYDIITTTELLELLRANSIAVPHTEPLTKAELP